MWSRFLQIQKLQIEGKSPVSYEEFINGHFSKNIFMIKRVKISIEYDGTSYVGWQAQRNGKSIQGEIEKALKEIFKENIKLYAAGRTDAGILLDK